MKIGVIGGGIIGLTTAYYLNKAGHHITVLDKGNMQEGCSYGNAGMIVPSHIIPLTAPGMIAKGLRWMFNASSPFYVKPRLDVDLAKWGYHFYGNANATHVKKSIPALRDLGLLSRAAYSELAKELPFDFKYHERGLLMLYQKAETEKEEIETAEIANENGIKAEVLTASQVQALEPDVKVSVRGGVFFPGDAHITPQAFMKGLHNHLKNGGVVFKEQCMVENFQIENGNIKRVNTSSGDYDFDEVVLTAGTWSGVLAKQLKINLPMQAGKGYSFTLPEVSKNIRIPSIFLEPRVAVTPMGSSLRFGGTMEICGNDPAINMNRVKGIVDAIKDFYPEMDVAMPKKEEVWYGFRPCSPDGLPYIGRSKQIKNLIFNTGHAMMGVSLATGSAKIVSRIIQAEAKVDPMFDPERFN